jgi:hypothetical protein
MAKVSNRFAMPFLLTLRLTSLNSEVIGMRWFKIAINSALAILLLFDVALAVQVCVHGWPAKVILTEASPGVQAVKVSRLPFTGTDVWILAALVVVHVLLIYLAWHFRKHRLAR